MKSKTEIIHEDLPTGFDELRAEARAEGFRQIERLATDWEARTTRFDREGEALLAVRVNDACRDRRSYNRAGRAERCPHAALLCPARLSP